MKWYLLKEKLKAIKSKEWLFIIIMASFLLIGIGCAIASLYLSGYTLWTWIQTYYPWLVLAGVIIYIVILTWILFKKRNKR